jgi:hypothetical protein
MMLNTTAFAPIAKASVRTAAAAKPGDLRNWRRANRRSCSRVVMVASGWLIWPHEKNVQFASQSVVTTTLLEQSRLRDLAGVWEPNNVFGFTGECA